ncbi:MAG: DUF411 domain-containing protein [Gemmobacter sp.]|nr:DUF411 domain-containing protein [Gemmobacter sp.]
MKAVPVHAQALPPIHVVKDPGCPCCNAWISHLRDNGFPVSFEERNIEALEVYKREQGIPENLASCHTATIDGYVLEGHVPAADIRRLLSQRPVAIGLAVPGMPYGSPGMGPEAEREAYDVILIGKDGSATTFTSYAAA